MFLIPDFLPSNSFRHMRVTVDVGARKIQAISRASPRKRPRGPTAKPEDRVSDFTSEYDVPLMLEMELWGLMCPAGFWS